MALLQTLRSARSAFQVLLRGASCTLRSAGSAFRVLLQGAFLCVSSCTGITRPFALLGGCFLDALALTEPQDLSPAMKV